MTEINYTVIIPHKNIPQLLQRCIESIPQRDDVQIIIVDDNSDPSVVDFEHFPGFDRPNTIVVFNKEGKGAGNARNRGLEQIKQTRWVVFADSDDLFSDIFTDKMDEYKDCDWDIIYFDTQRVSSETLRPIERRSETSLKLKQAKLSGDLDLLRYKNHVPWGKFISYELIRNNSIKFDCTKVSNDVMFGLKIGHLAKSVKIDDSILYYITEREGSLTKIINKSAIQCRYNVAVNAMHFLQSVGKDVYHSNLFAYTYTFSKINIWLAIRYFFTSFRHTPLKYWSKDIGACINHIRKL